MHQYRAPFRELDTFFAVRSWVDCITNMSGFDLRQAHPHAKASASNVAQKLAISTRTLSRKLRDEDVAFGEILEETRAALAKRYLAERDLPVSEIAWLLGYVEVSSFTNAFKRWTGMTPRQFRLTP